MMERIIISPHGDWPAITAPEDTQQITPFKPRVLKKFALEIVEPIVLNAACSAAKRSMGSDVSRTTLKGKAFKRCAQHDGLTPVELSRPSYDQHRLSIWRAPKCLGRAQ
jgi:hypothetical protein